jgi:hypothetical protein
MPAPWLASLALSSWVLLGIVVGRQLQHRLGGYLA